MSVVLVETCAVFDNRRCIRLVLGYGVAAHGIGGKPTVANAADVAGEVPASPQGWLAGPDLDASGCSKLKGINGRSQKSLCAGSREMRTGGSSTDVPEGKER